MRENTKVERQKGGWTGEVAEMRLEGVGLVECWRFFWTEVWEKLRGNLKSIISLAPSFPVYPFDILGRRA